MTKTWADMMEAEKIEELRQDVKRIFGLLRKFQDAISSDQSMLQSQISELDQKIAALENGRAIPRKK